MILADRYGFSFLKERIENCLIFFLKHKIGDIILDSDIRNIFVFHSHAQICGAVELQEECEKFFDTNAEAVITSPEIHNLPKENLKLLISRDSFLVDEMLVFDAVRSWISFNRQEREEVEDLLECVRLSEISREELDREVLTSGLFEQDQVTDAKRIQDEADRDSMAPRGKRGKTIDTPSYIRTCICSALSRNMCILQKVLHSLRIP